MELVEVELAPEQRETRALEGAAQMERVGALTFHRRFQDSVEAEVNDCSRKNDQRDEDQNGAAQSAHMGSPKCKYVHAHRQKPGARACLQGPRAAQLARPCPAAYGFRVSSTIAGYLPECVAAIVLH